MTIGNVIRKYRKEKGLTQEEMAARLGVTAPAVNKWEKNSTLPDVALLAPIARLLGISTDELLCFRENLTDEEVNQILSRIQEDLDRRDFLTGFCSAQKAIEKYPNCEKLIWQAAALLDAKRTEDALPDTCSCDAAIIGWYERCLSSQDEGIRSQAADCLFHISVRKQDYEKAAHYLAYFSRENPERKRKEALVNSKTGKRPEAYRACEELLYTGYLHIQQVLNDLRILYLEDGDSAMAKKLVDVSSAAASAFEMGRYHEISYGLDVAVWEKDAPWTAELMGELLDSVDTLGDAAKSKLYQHMVMKPADPVLLAGIRQELIKSLDEEHFSYMRGNEAWESLKRSVSP